MFQPRTRDIRDRHNLLLLALVRPTQHREVDQPGRHPEHPTAVEGCRPISRGLQLELVTYENSTTSNGKGKAK